MNVIPIHGVHYSICKRGNKYLKEFKKVANKKKIQKKVTHTRSTIKLTHVPIHQGPKQVVS